MGNRRHKPQRLAEKLLAIRNAFSISQTELLRRLGVQDLIVYNQISRYESGDREPTLPILLQYARLAGVHMEALVDDDLNLPDKLPGDVRHEEIRRQYAPPGKQKRARKR